MTGSFMGFKLPFFRKRRLTYTTKDEYRAEENFLKIARAQNMGSGETSVIFPGEVIYYKKGPEVKGPKKRKNRY